MRAPTMRSEPGANPKPESKQMKQIPKTERLGNICKIIMAGDVLAATPAAKHKSRWVAHWTIVVSGEAGPLSIRLFRVSCG